MLTFRINKRNLIDSVFSGLIILLPFLCQYKGIGSTVSLGELVLMPFIIYFLLQKVFRKRINNIDKALLTFYCVAIFFTIINTGFSYFDLSSAATAILRLFYYMFLVYVAKEHFKFETVQNFYIGLIFVFSVYLLLQVIVYYGFGFYLPIYLKHSWQFPPDARPETYSAMYIYGFRPSSLFLEASYFALFVLPGIAIILFENRKVMSRTITLIASCAAIVFSTSSAGMIGLGILLGIKVFKSSNKSSFKTLAGKIGVIIIGVTAIGYMLYSENAYTLRSRLFSGGSIGQRVIRGFIVYSELNPFHKLFGVGINNMEAYMIENNISTIYDERNLNNCASILQTLNYFGIIGLIFFIVYIVSYMRKSKGNIGLSLAVLITYMLCYDAILFMYKFGFLFILLDAINVMERTSKNCSAVFRGEEENQG